MELQAFVYSGISTYSEEIAEPSMVLCNCSTKRSVCRLHMILLSLPPTVQFSKEAKEAQIEELRAAEKTTTINSQERLPKKMCCVLCSVVCASRNMCQ
jgi:hypothetical protein